MSPARLQRSALALAALSGLLLVGTALLGPSAAEPGLAPRGGTPTWREALPPYDLGLHPSSALVTALLAVAYVAGGVAVAAGLVAARRGARLPRWALPAGAAVAVLAVLVPPIGSADHLSYAAYGRIAVGGGDPWLESPVAWAGGRDPVTSAVEEPWRTTPSIYGPVATAVQALTSLVGGDSLHLTVWAWQLVCLAAWLAVGALVVRHARDRTRAAWLWPLNPVLLGLLLVGAHVDLLAAALGLGALLLAGRRPLAAGLCLGAAAGVKVTLLLLGPALLYASWRNRSGWRSVVLGVVGSLVVLVPTYVAAGPHVLDQLGRARAFVSLATPWRPLVDALTGPLPGGTVRAGVQVAWPLVMVVLVLLLARVTGAPGRRARGDAVGVTADAALAAVVLGGAYVLAAPYSLPWYDALVWAPLPLVAAGPVDALLLARLTVLALAYVPGRVVGLAADVERLTLGARRHVAPWLALALLTALVVAAARATPVGRSRAVPVTGGRGDGDDGGAPP